MTFLFKSHSSVTAPGAHVLPLLPPCNRYEATAQLLVFHMHRGKVTSVTAFCARREKLCRERRKTERHITYVIRVRRGRGYRGYTGNIYLYLSVLSGVSSVTSVSLAMRGRGYRGYTGGKIGSSHHHREDL